MGDSSEVRGVDIVFAADLLWTESQVGGGQTTSLEGVIVEVPLSILWGFISDDLDAVLVGTNGSVRTLTEEDALDSAFWDEGEVVLTSERLVGNIVVDRADEVVHLLTNQVVEDSNDVGWDEVLGGLAITTADDLLDLVQSAGFLKGRNDIESEWLTCSGDFLASVKDADALDGLWELGNEVVDGEWAVESDEDGTNLTTVLVEIVDSFFNGDAARTHQDNDFSSVSGAVVFEDFVLTTGDLLANLKCLDELVLDLTVNVVLGFLSLEPDGGTHAGAHAFWMLWVESAQTELLDFLVWDEWLDLFIVNHFDLLNSVRGSETVEGVDNWVGTLDCSQVGDNGEVHGLLHIW